jgi:perosamine synthetase
VAKRSIPFALPDIGEDEIAAVAETLRSGWITTGPRVEEFERSVSNYIGSKYAVAVNSCTAALHLALEAIGLDEGDTVITTPMTFAASAEVIRYFKAVPLFVDIEPETMNIDTTKIEEALSLSSDPGRIKAIVPVHYAGHPCEMDHIKQIAKKYGLAVVEDAAHAFPSQFRGQMIGTVGDITCFSFYATKNINIGEGGMAVTSNSRWAERMRVMSLHGIDKDAWKRHSAETQWYYEIIAPGYKYNLTDIAATLGLSQMEKIETLQQRREQIASLYNDVFQNLSQIEPLTPREHVKHSWQLYVIKVNPEALTISRNLFIEDMKSRGIGTSVHFVPLHIHPYYINTYGYRPDDFPVSFQCYERIISLPIYPRMTDEDVFYVIDSVRAITKKYAK